MATAIKKCHDCGAVEGQLHAMGCDMETCPFCAGQLITCDCCYESLLLIDTHRYTEETAYLPPEIYENGLTEEQRYAWFAVLEAKGRIHYVVYPNMCARCGKLWPDMFMVPNEEWAKYVDPREQDKMLCRKCYNWIKKRIDKMLTVNKEQE